MDGIPAGMAELQRSVKIQKRARKAGFDWPSAEPVMDKFDEELLEMREAMASGDHDAMQDELGDLLFVATNLARKLDIDPGTALRRSNAKFERRFRAMEEAAGGQEGLDSLELDEMEAVWQEIKKTTEPDPVKRTVNVRDDKDMNEWLALLDINSLVVGLLAGLISHIARHDHRQDRPAKRVEEEARVSNRS